MMVCKTSGLALFNSSRKSTIGFPSIGNQYGARNTVMSPDLSGRPMRSPGSLICPRNSATTFIFFSAKYFVRISDFPIPCLPASIMFCSAGVVSRTYLSSSILTFTFITEKLSLIIITIFSYSSISSPGHRCQRSLFRTFFS